MQNNIFTNLKWLKEPDENFSSIINNIKYKNVDIANCFELINHYYLDFRNAQIINGFLSKRNFTDGNKLYEDFNLGIISNSNFEFIIPSLKAYALKNYIILNCYNGPYGQTINYLNKVDNVFNKKKIDAFLIAIDPTQISENNFRKKSQLFLDEIDQIVKTINAKYKRPCIVQNFSELHHNIYGNIDIYMQDTSRKVMLDVNNLLKDKIKENSYNYLFDIEKLSYLIGLDLWKDLSFNFLVKSPISKTAIPLYANSLSNLIGSLKGKSKRIIILDLDNTLWGGNIGDLGIDKIELGSTSPIGEAFLYFQKYLLALRDRGIILAIASKNNSDIAMNAINNHPEMLIREKHIAAYEINWKDKAQNILSICNKVKLGTQSAVFIDDNPFERGLVRDFLPSVSVPELPSDPSYYVNYISAANYFETTYFSEDDKLRANFFEAEQKRINLKKHNNNVNDYLFKLKMKADVKSFQKIDIKRLEQLINKSNQFNLTTKRYSYGDLLSMINNKTFKTLQVRLSDIYGENGIIAIVILKKENKSYIIDTWIQSCRILERKIENYVLQKIIEKAKLENIHYIVGLFIPTKKNGIVKEHYKRLGFKISKNEKSLSQWKLDIKKYKMQNLPII